MENLIDSNQTCERAIDFSEETSEILACKYLLLNKNEKITQFVFGEDRFKLSLVKDKTFQRILEIVKTHFTQYKYVAQENVLREIFKNSENKYCSDELNHCLDRILNYNDSSISDEYYKDIVTGYINARLSYSAIIDNIANVEKTGSIEVVRAALDNITYFSSIEDDDGIDYFQNMDNHIQNLCKNESRTAFGYNELDMYTYGGLPTNDTCLFVVMAQPGLGKSQFMLNLAHHWVLNGKKVLMISLEMSEDMYSRRLDALFADVNVNRLNEHIGALRCIPIENKARGGKGTIRIKEFPTGTFTTSQLKFFLKRLKDHHGFTPDIIFVDYLNIMRPNGNKQYSLYEKCACIAEELRAISGELKIPVVTAVQANRSGNNGGYATDDIDLNNVSESAGITATADALVALYRTKEDIDNKLMNLKILKNRLGGYIGKVVKFSLNPETLQISDYIPPEDDCQSIDDDVLNGAESISSNSIKSAGNQAIYNQVPQNNKLWGMTGSMAPQK